MSPQRFAEINIQALATLFDADEMVEIATNVHTVQADTAKVAQYVAGLLNSTNRQQEFANAIAETLALESSVESA